MQKIKSQIFNYISKYIQIEKCTVNTVFLINVALVNIGELQKHLKKSFRPQTFGLRACKLLAYEE